MIYIKPNGSVKAVLPGAASAKHFISSNNAPLCSDKIIHPYKSTVEIPTGRPSHDGAEDRENIQKGWRDGISIIKPSR